MPRTIRRTVYLLIFVGVLIASPRTEASLVWGNCGEDATDARPTEVCPNEGDNCAPIEEELSECQCENHDGVWRDGVCEEE